MSKNTNRTKSHSVAKIEIAEDSNGERQRSALPSPSSLHVSLSVSKELVLVQWSVYRGHTKRRVFSNLTLLDRII